MASTIAAVTTGVGGLVQTADASGNLSLLSGTTTVLAATSTGVHIPGSLTGLYGAGGIIHNIAIGDTALDSNTTGTSNTALGWHALTDNTTGGSNTALGWNTLASNTIGQNNLAVGYVALNANTTGTNNVGIGYGTLQLNVSGISNTAVGIQALNTSTVDGLTAIGFQALKANTTGTYNTAVGYAALNVNTTGTQNTAVGYNALNDNTTGIQNTAVGSHALQANTTGTNNTAVGLNALYSNTTGTYNTALGSQALQANTTGSNNTAVGYNTGLLLTTGGSNQVFGDSITLSAAATGRIAIGRNFTQGVDNSVIIGNATARISCPYTVSATWTFSSDERIKNVIGKDTLGLDFINDLEPVTYRWKPSDEIPKELTTQYAEENVKDTDIVMHGLIAQNVKAALDKAGVDTFTGWSVDIDGTQRLGMADLITPLINAIKELDAKFEAYKAAHP